MDARTLSCVLVLLRYRRLCIDAGRLAEKREKHMPELEQLESDAEQLEENRKRIEADKEAALSHAQETRKKCVMSRRDAWVRAHYVAVEDTVWCRRGRADYIARYDGFR